MIEEIHSKFYPKNHKNGDTDENDVHKKSVIMLCRYEIIAGENHQNI